MTGVLSEALKLQTRNRALHGEHPDSFEPSVLYIKHSKDRDRQYSQGWAGF
jgi:hypothetical protein